MTKEFDDTLRSIARLNAAATVGDVCKTLLDICSDYGFDAVLGGFIPDPEALAGNSQNNVILDKWPLEWATRYFGRGYIAHDPAILATRASTSAFRWREMQAAQPVQRLILNEAGDFGLKDGVTVPLHPIEGGVIGLSMAGDRLDLPPLALGGITLLATYAVGQTLLLATRPPQPILTHRQHEVLKWVVAGKTISEIGTILSISNDTANNHVRALNTKFMVSTRAQLAAEALRHRLVQ
jgi:LuxR family transcriptional regulator, quorum-sensing system regulator BjaR1